MLKIIFLKKNFILIYFLAKNTLNRHRYYNPKQFLKIPNKVSTGNTQE